MTGVKGRSGGPRKNSGGARPGAGRKRNPNVTPRKLGSVWMQTRARILERDNYLCCCSQCRSSGNPLPANQVDHVVPLWQGGTDQDDNLQSMNSKCHKAKTAREAAEKASPPPVLIPPCDMLEMLQRVALGQTEATPLQVRAAIAAVQYTHAKKGEGGKKEAKGQAADKAGAGRFAPASGPRLASVNGLKVVGAKGA